MPDGKVLLIVGRSMKQGTGLNLGKGSNEYREATTTLELGAADMARLGVLEGDAVVLSTVFGQALVRCRQGNLPAGMAFMAYGPAANELTGSETHASGMPNSKCFEVSVQPAGGTAHAS